MKPRPTLKPRLRITRGSEIALGPGKADLLQALDTTGSLAAAARQLGMSYMRAWSLIKTMERQFNHPLVLSARGGTGRGGTRLTPTARKALTLYRRMETTALKAITPDWKRLQRLLAP